MQYQRLGDTGLVVSRLSLGAMTFGSGTGAMGSIWKVDQALANRMVSRSLDALTTPEPLYPAWHIDKTGDPAVTEALTRPTASGRSA